VFYLKTSTKERIKIALIIISSVVLAIITLSLFTGRLQTEEIIVAADEEININLGLGEQIELFEKVEISKKEFELLKGSVVTDFDELEGMRVNYQLSPGTPIPRSSLIGGSGAGEFAASLPEGKTVHMFPQAAVDLPPVVPGDLINVGITFEDESPGPDRDIKSVIFLYDLEVINVIQGDIYVIVSLEESLQINSASEIGSFFYQLPGKMSLPLCSEIKEQVEEERKEAEEGEDTTNLGINEENEDSEKSENSNNATIECLDEDYQPKEISSQDILNKLRRGESLNFSKRDLEKQIQELNQELEDLEDEKEREKSEDSRKNREDEDNSDSSDNVSINKSDNGCDIKVIDDERYVIPNHENYEDVDDEDVLYWLCDEEDALDEGLESL